MNIGNGRILLAHGAGGRLTHELIEKVFLSEFKNPVLNRLDDAAELNVPPDRIAFTTDAFVVRPLYFPGGDIGKLSVCGTVNDLAMKGAMPLALSMAIIMEEGFPMEDLKKIVRSMKETAQKAHVEIVCGDTKVVEKGCADKIFVVSAGIGVVIALEEISGTNARVGDAVILSGTVGDHGISVLQARGEYEFQGTIVSDCAPLHDLVASLLEACPQVHALRDPTRGGLATTLNEIAKSSQVRIEIEEEKIDVLPSVRAACNLLGVDPLYIANEGKFVAFVPEQDAEMALAALRKNSLGSRAARIGRVAEGKAGVEMITSIGGRRPLRMLEGEQLPRIC